MERASRRLTPVLLELGGKDPMIVLRDADLERAANAAVVGRLSDDRPGVHVGGARLRRAGRRRGVHREGGRASVRALRVGPNGADADIDMGPFTGPRQLEIVERHLDDARAKGARILAGGAARRKRRRCFFQPTVLADVDHSMLVMTEETFGPLIPIMPVADADAAVAWPIRAPTG